VGRAETEHTVSGRVTFEHRDLEAFEADAAAMAATFEEPGAWTGTLAAFRSWIGAAA
jgi:hypothetical protein